MSKPSAKAAEFGHFIKAQRQEKGYTQVTFAEATQMSQRWVSDLERGLIEAPRLSTLRSISQVLSLPLDDLIIRTGLVSDRGSAQTLMIQVPTATATAEAYPPDVGSNATGYVTAGSATAKGGTHTATVDAIGRVVPLEGISRGVGSATGDTRIERLAEIRARLTAEQFNQVLDIALDLGAGIIKLNEIPKPTEPEERQRRRAAGE